MNLAIEFADYYASHAVAIVLEQERQFFGKIVAAKDDEIAKLRAERELYKQMVLTQAKSITNAENEVERLRKELAHEKARHDIGGDIFEAGRNRLILHLQTELEYLQRAEQAEAAFEKEQQTSERLMKRWQEAEAALRELSAKQQVEEK